METGYSWVADPTVDALTGALGRGGLAACLDGALAQASRAGGDCSLFLFDVDHFKSINDAYGHGRGDTVLRQLADRTAQLIRGSDVLIRYGGDEFVLVLPATGHAEAMEVASRLVDGVKNQPFPGTPSLSVSVSVGVATFPEDAKSCDGLLEVADRRSYLAKRRGRGRTVGDDLASGVQAALGRLLERDAPLAAAQDFLVRLVAQRRGTLRVSGDPGAGHSRFLAEVTNLARLRGFSVRGATGPGAGAIGGRDSAGSAEWVLIVADTEVDLASARDLLRELASGENAPAVLGLLDAVHGTTEEAPLPLLATVALSPLSDEAMRVWLRTTLSGEPSPALVAWISERSRGLPARAEREVARLADGGSLDQSSKGGWSLTPALLARVTAARRRLPATLSSLIGREEDITRVAQLLTGRRLVTLVGPGGIGKTRLSLAVATALADDYDEGAVFVPLAEATTTALAASAVAQVLEVAEVPGEPLVDTVLNHLADRNLLLVLDNFEQVLTAAPFVAKLLVAAPGIKILSTSRERLRLSGEQLYPVLPLALPDLTQLPSRTQDIGAALATSPALTLFHTRARQAVYDLTWDPADLRAAAEVCHRLDGLPLAIELAAARSDSLPPADLLRQLTKRFDLLADGPLDLPIRHQALRATIDWSFDLLDPLDKDLIRTVAAFAGGCTTEAVTTVWAPTEPLNGSVTNHLIALSDKSLLCSTSTSDGIRYTMLESIRAYAGERLAISADIAEVHSRHATHFAALADEANEQLAGPGQADWQDRVTREYLNLRAAFEWAMVNGEAGTAGRITLGIGRYWDSGRHIGEGREWYQRILATEAPLPDRLRAELLGSAAFLAAIQNDVAVTQRLGEECVGLARELGDPKILAPALNVLGIAAEMAGDYERCRMYHHEGLALAEQQHDKPGVAAARVNLALLALSVGDLDVAHELALLNLELERELGNTSGIALNLECLGQIKVRRGDADGARPLLTESLELSRRLGYIFYEAEAMHQLGLVALLDGDRAQAYQQIAAALRLSQGVGYQDGVVSALVDLADLLSTSDPKRAAGLLGAADAVQENHRLTLHLHARARREETLEQVRATLTESSLTAAWTTGRSATLDDLVKELVTLDPSLCASSDLP
jgi:diguanylate cyclase (GGDEF)-like protein